MRSHLGVSRRRGRAAHPQPMLKRQVPSQPADTEQDAAHGTTALLERERTENGNGHTTLSRGERLAALAAEDERAPRVPPRRHAR